MDRKRGATAEPRESTNHRKKQDGNRGWHQSDDALTFASPPHVESGMVGFSVDAATTKKRKEKERIDPLTISPLFGLFSFFARSIAFAFLFFSHCMSMSVSCVEAPGART